MAVLDGHPVLIGCDNRPCFARPQPRQRTCCLAFILVSTLLVQGCGLIFDAVRLVHPITTNELDAICRRGEIHVGMAVEPFRPFVFPALWTDEGARVTGLDAELVQLLSNALTERCGTSVAPQLHLIRFRDLFLLLNEGRLDFFVSAVARGTPSPQRAGIAYSSSYFRDGGLTGISKRPEILELIQVRLSHTGSGGASALKGLAIAVQDGTDAYWYAQAFLQPGRLIVCDSLPAAFEYENDGVAPLDVILGAKPVLDFVVKTARRDWRSLRDEQGHPLVFTDADYGVVMAEESYSLRWLINDTIFKLRTSGRLDSMRQRWLEDAYAYPRRASTEGLSFDVKQMPKHYAQGTCRESSLHSQ